jgi:hypothetical protein
MRSLVVTGCAAAGVWLLAGPGWALVAGAGLVLVLWRGAEPDVRAAASGVFRSLRGGWARVRSAPRRSAAIALAGAAVCLAPLGFALTLTAGLAVVVTAGALAAGGLLLGWNA